MVDVATWGRWLDGGDQGVYPFTGSAARLWSECFADLISIPKNATLLAEYLKGGTTRIGGYSSTAKASF